MPFVMPFLLAMIVTVAWLPILARLATKWGIVDLPGGRKVHRAPIPRVGGLAMAFGVGVAALVAVPLEAADKSFLVAAGVLALVGALDDRIDLDYRLKLCGQLLAAGIVVFQGGTKIHALTLDDQLLLPEWISLPLTMIFLVGITNAINLADGLDGLAGGTTFLCLCALGMLAFSFGEMSSTALALCFAGAVLGFLRFNTYPASVFMGDAGSQMLGFAVGVLGIRATQSGSSPISAATPVLLLALPILDTLSVMVQRVSEGRSPFSADKNHIHHKLLSLGFNHHEAVMVIYAIQADLFLLAYWLRYESDLVILGVTSLFFVAAIAFFQLASKFKWRIRAPDDGSLNSPVVRVISMIRQPKRLPRWSYLTVAAAALGYAVLVTADAARLSVDVRLLLMGLLSVSTVWFAILRAKPFSLIEKGALYVTAAVIVYLDSTIVPEHGVVKVFTWIAVLIMALGTLVNMRLAVERRFELTSLDLIVLFVALVVPSLGDSFGLPDGGAPGIAKLVVLFYAIEVLGSRQEVPVVWLRVAATALLAGLSVRSFW